VFCLLDAGSSISTSIAARRYRHKVEAAWGECREGHVRGVAALNTAICCGATVGISGFLLDKWSSDHTEYFEGLETAFCSEVAPLADAAAPRRSVDERVRGSGHSAEKYEIEALVAPPPCKRGAGSGESRHKGKVRFSKALVAAPRRWETHFWSAAARGSCTRRGRNVDGWIGGSVVRGGTAGRRRGIWTPSSTEEDGSLSAQRRRLPAGRHRRPASSTPSGPVGEAGRKFGRPVRHNALFGSARAAALSRRRQRVVDCRVPPPRRWKNDAGSPCPFGQVALRSVDTLRVCTLSVEDFNPRAFGAAEPLRVDGGRSRVKHGNASKQSAGHIVERLAFTVHSTRGPDDPRIRQMSARVAGLGVIRAEGAADSAARRVSRR